MATSAGTTCGVTIAGTQRMASAWSAEVAKLRTQPGIRESIASMSLSEIAHAALGGKSERHNQTTKIDASSTHFSQLVEHSADRRHVEKCDGRSKNRAQGVRVQHPARARHAERYESRRDTHKNDLAAAEQQVDAEAAVDRAAVAGERRSTRAAVGGGRVLPLELVVAPLQMKENFNEQSA